MSQPAAEADQIVAIGVQQGGDVPVLRDVDLESAGPGPLDARGVRAGTDDGVDPRVQPGVVDPIDVVHQCPSATAEQGCDAKGGGHVNSLSRGSRVDGSLNGTGRPDPSTLTIVRLPDVTWTVSLEL